MAEVPNAFQSLIVNNGSPNRSFVRYLTLTFTSPGVLENVLASLATPSPLIKLTFLGLNGTNSAPVPLTASEVSVSGNVLSINFGAAGITGHPTSTAGDGYYQVSVDPNGTGNFTTKTFDRLLGDVLGTGTVTSNDYNDVYLASILTPNATQFDVDGNGVVNATDVTLVKTSEGRHLSGTLQLDA